MTRKEDFFSRPSARPTARNGSRSTHRGQQPRQPVPTAPPPQPPTLPPPESPTPPSLPHTSCPTPVQFEDDELDIDYIEVTGPCVVLSYINPLTFTLGSSVREQSEMLLVAKWPGYVYVAKEFKDNIMDQLEVHFKYPLDASDDDRSLLEWQRRRITGHDLAWVLVNAGVTSVKYVDYAMKAKLESFLWVDNLLRNIPESSVIMDVATMTKPSAPGRVKLVRWTRHRPEGCRGYNHVLYGPMQEPPYYGSVMAKRERSDVADPTMLKCLVYSRANHIFKAAVKPGRLDQPRRNKFLRLARPYFNKLENKFRDQQDVMGDVRTEIRFRVRSIREIPAQFSRQFTSVWSLLDVVEIDSGKVLRMQRAALEWADANNLFVGENTARVSAVKYVTFNLLLNAFGVWNQFSQNALKPSRLLLNLHAKLLITGVLPTNIMAVGDTDEEMKENEPIVLSSTESDTLTLDDIDSQATEIDPDMVFQEIFEHISVSRRGRYYVCNLHTGEYCTRQRSREQVAQVVLERYGAQWHEFVVNTR